MDCNWCKDKKGTATYLLIYNKGEYYWGCQNCAGLELLNGDRERFLINAKHISEINPEYELEHTEYVQQGIRGIEW